MSKIIGLASTACRSSTSRARAYRVLGLALAAAVSGIALQPEAASAQYWGYGPWYGGYGPPPGYSRPYAPYRRAYDDQLRPGGGP
jgi:hypothetical protein